MLQRQTIGDKSALVAYLDDEFKLVHPEQATLIKILFDDGSRLWLTPSRALQK
jgi:hypothetical protein